jgi:CMP-N,N'-diacetyllegionaminic acid synthase
MGKIVALIPARSGSIRVPDKNIRYLRGHPLIAYTINAALESAIFDAVVVSTDSTFYAEIAKHYGANVPFLRPGEFAGPKSPDIEWVTHALNQLEKHGKVFNFFCILRPTSPFRKAETIKRAWKQFCEFGQADSLRAVELCSQHPGKMWVIRGKVMYPIIPVTPSAQPWHSSQFAALPRVYVQNASLEIARRSVVVNGRTIAGEIIQPFVTEAFEGFDINKEEDWVVAEHFIESGEASLPEITQVSFKNKSYD